MFNPHPRMEGDDMSCQGQTDVSLFQSTPSHGGRHALPGRRTGCGRFNPRPHMAGDGTWACVL